MSNRSSLQIFLDECAGIKYEKDSPLCNHSSFRIGGNADYIVFPESESALCALVDYLTDEKYKYTVIGNATNVLFQDEGYKGVVNITSALKRIKRLGNTLYAGCGASVTHLAQYARKCGLSGLEFVYGIPGSVGGAVYMNAGAYGGEIKDVLIKSTYFDPLQSKKCELYKAGHEFGHRTTFYTDKENTILSAVFELKPGDPDEIGKTMDGYLEARKSKQPLEFPSAGSFFKRYPGRYTGQMIEEAGLKGCKIGGAMVSPKHAGFIVNTGNATSKDVKELAEYVKNAVYEKFGVIIEREVKYIDL